MSSVNEGHKPARNWWFILYPESAPSDWVESLQSRVVPFAVSPLHDHCLDDNGQPKKPHYHIILTYDGPTTYNHVLELTRSLNQPIPLRVESLSGAYAYLTHSNSPEKYQYSSDDIRLFNGFKVPRLSGGKGDKMMARLQLCSIIRERDIVEFSQLVEYVTMNDFSEDVINSLFRDAYFYSQYIRSIRFTLDNKMLTAMARACNRDADFFRQMRYPVPDNLPDINSLDG